jgi:peptidoglycan hydrolase-like protein with peptidoglycan-binding domain
MAGFHADSEDTKWWMFGVSTVSAVQTFQACNGLPESGVCCNRTWAALASTEPAAALAGTDAHPHHLDLWRSGDSDDEDLEAVADGHVYLLGEQRWARKL